MIDQIFEDSSVQHISSSVGVFQFGSPWASMFNLRLLFVSTTHFAESFNEVFIGGFSFIFMNNPSFRALHPNTGNKFK